MLITAADVVNTAADSAQLLPMLEESEEMTGVRVPVTLADGGYQTAKNLEAGARRGDVFVMPECYHPGVQGPYFKDRFVYDAGMESYVCPQGGQLPFRGLRRTTARSQGRSASTALREPCVVYAQPMGSVLRISTPDVLCGSDPPIPHSVSIGSGWQLSRPRPYMLRGRV